MNDTIIAIATHKKYRMPKGQMYMPIQAGADVNKTNLGYVKDNTGDNISNENPGYSELTALYWLWKNTDAKYKGIAHYRRQFSKKKIVNNFSVGNFEDVLDEKRLKELFNSTDIILPTKRRYFIESVGSHYKHTHHEQDLLVTEAVLKKSYPEYVKYFEAVLSKRSAHMFNMFIMKNELFDSYCGWLFPILFQVEKNLDTSTYSDFHKRVYGRISEILLDVWIDKNGYKYSEAPVMFMEKQNWYAKIDRFLKAKFVGKRY